MMPWEKTGKKPGKRPHAPYKLAVTLLYGIGTPGVRRMGDGKVVCEMVPLSQSLRISGRHIKECAEKLHEWGVFSTLDVSRGFFVAEFAKPGVWSE